MLQYKNLSTHSKQLVCMYRDIHDMYRYMYMELDEIKLNCMQAGNQETIADTVYVLKKVSEFADRLRKDTNNVLELVQKLGCLHAAHTPDNKLVGELATGSGNATQQLAVPDRDKDPEKYALVCKALGIPDDIAARRTVKLSFSGCAEYLSQLAEQGLPIPPELADVRTYPKFSISARAKAQVDLDTLAQESKTPTAIFDQF